MPLQRKPSPIPSVSSGEDFEGYSDALSSDNSGRNDVHTLDVPEEVYLDAVTIATAQMAQMNITSTSRNPSTPIPNDGEPADVAMHPTSDENQSIPELAYRSAVLTPDVNPLTTAVYDHLSAHELKKLLPSGKQHQEMRIHYAIAWLDRPPLNRQDRHSQNNAAKRFDVVRSTLSGRLSGTQTRVASHEHQQLLTATQEMVLVKWIVEKGRRAIPLTPRAITSCAQAIIGTRAEIGEHWHKGFLKRHPELKVRWSTGLEKCRRDQLNPVLVGEYFTLLAEIIHEYKIKPENIYNMDEKGVYLGTGTKEQVVVDHDQKTVHSIVDGSRELVTLIECICADGSAIRPAAIYKGLRRNDAWFDDNPGNITICMSPNGWTDQELGALWLEKVFEPQTNEEKNLPTDEYRLLILDGHNSHCSFAFINLADAYCIIILCLPSHTTHALQPCDVCVFSPLERAWLKQVREAARTNSPIDKSTFLRHYFIARTAAMKATTITAAFRKTGIYPLDSQAVPVEAFAPALETTTQAVMTLPVSPPLFPVPPLPTPTTSTPSSNPTNSRNILVHPENNPRDIFENLRVTRVRKYATATTKKKRLAHMVYLFGQK